MPGEFPAEVGRDFVNRMSLFFQDNFGFSVAHTTYEGRGGASVIVDGERVRFDLIMNQKRKRFLQNQETEYKIHFFCECKWRSNPRDLKTQLKDFLKKAIKVLPELHTQCSDNFRFVFVCNKHFGVDQSDLESIEYLNNFLNEGYNTDELSDLMRRVRILVLADWFLGTTSKGRV